MRVKVNGKEMDLRDNITIKELIEELKIEGKVMAAAINMEVVKKENWDEKTINEDDKIELLQFVGGG
jgi:sulfur carrier protein